MDQFLNATVSIISIAYKTIKNNEQMDKVSLACKITDKGKLQKLLHGTNV